MRIMTVPPLFEVAAPEQRRLPMPLTPFVGRAAARAAVRSLLLRSGVRLVTLTGPGGVGKTRLALAVATDLAPLFADGVCLVPLAPIRSPDLVLPTIAQALDVRDEGRRPLLERLQRRLQDQHLLLVLDNLEHVVTAAPLIVDLLVACPRLRLLVTSRIVLHVSGEHEYPVPPLSLPDAVRQPALPELTETEAVTLFLQRARAVRPHFVLSEANASTVAEICRRLDGLPLAIELAAARINVLSAHALLDRLTGTVREPSLQLLAGGPRDQPARLQTMRAAIAWSYDLLTEEEQFLFRRLAVFVGGFTLDAAEWVMGNGEWVIDESGTPSPITHHLSPASVLDGLASLVGKSLLHRAETDEGEPRFGMLETIREFGLELLAEAGETATIRDRHARWCLDLASRTLSFPLRGTVRPNALDRVEIEIGNVRAALAWLSEHGEVASQIELAATLTHFWSLRSYRAEGRQWLERALAMTEGRDIPPEIHAIALHAAAALARTQAGDGADHAAAAALAEEALTRFRELGDARNIATVLDLLGMIERSRGDHGRAEALHEEAVALFREIGEPLWVALASCNLGLLAHWRGDDSRAVARLEDALAGSRAVDDPWGIGLSLSGLALVTSDQGDHDRAAAMHQESLVWLRQVGSKEALVDAVARIATLAMATGDAARAARLLGAVEALGQALGYALEHPEQGRYARAADDARAVLGDDALRAAWVAGQALSIAEAVTEATAVLTTPKETGGQQKTAGVASSGLSPREIDVLRLLAAGRSDRAIAAALFISHRTVQHHVAKIFAKLGVRTRAAATRAALAAGLLTHESVGPEPGSLPR